LLDSFDGEEDEEEEDLSSAKKKAAYKDRPMVYGAIPGNETF